MPAASLETTLELWSTTLRQAKHRIRPLFAAPSVAASAHAFLDGLLGAERRKTGWMRAEAAGDPGPWRQQAILGRSHWNADALRDVVRDHVIETLGAPEAVLVLDETGFLKQGHASCGVGRQYTGSAGKITNCQIGVFAAYVSDKGHAFIDRQLYLPKAWTGDPARMTAAHVPAGITFATKPHLALGMVARAIAAGVPFAWVTADSVSGVGEIELALRRADKGYVLGVTGQHSFWSWGPRPRYRARPRRSRQPSWRRTGSASRRGRVLVQARVKADSFWGFQTGASLTPWWRTGGSPCGQGLPFVRTMMRPSFGHGRKRPGMRVKVGVCWRWPRSTTVAPGPRQRGSAASGCRPFGTGLCGSPPAVLKA